MKPEELLRAGNLDEALIALQSEVRTAPADPRLRIALFQLLCVLGQWPRAETQVGVISEMGEEHALLAMLLRTLLQAELLRAATFRGERTPMIFGEPEPWLALLVQANHDFAKGRFEEANRLREQSFEQAPAIAGEIDGTPFTWVADADSRLGPVLEAYVEGKYYWVPFHRIRSIRLAPPAELRDLVWAPAHFTWANGGSSSGFIPARYPGTETSADPLLRQARKTEWTEKTADFYVGLGQRTLTTDVAEFPLLEVRELSLHPAET